MADKFTQTNQQRFLARCHQTMESAPSIVGSLKQTLLDCNANWEGYAAIEDDNVALAASGAAFAAKCSTAWSAAKPDLEVALDVLAAGMGTTRDTLLTAMQE